MWRSEATMAIVGLTSGRSRSRARTRDVVPDLLHPQIDPGQLLVDDRSGEGERQPGEPHPEANGVGERRAGEHGVAPDAEAAEPGPSPDLGAEPGNIAHGAQQVAHDP